MYPVAYRNNTVVGALLRGSQFRQSAPLVPTTPRAPGNTYIPGPHDRAVQWRGRSGVPMVDRPPRRNIPRVGNYVGPAAISIRRAFRFASTASRLRHLYDAYRYVEGYVNYDATQEQRETNRVIREMGNYTAQQTCCPKPIGGLSRNYLWVTCDPPCTYFPGGGAIDGDIYNPDGSTATTIGSWTTEGEIYAFGNQRLDAQRTLFTRTGPRTGFADDMQYATWLAPAAAAEISVALDAWASPGGFTNSGLKSPARWMQPFRQPNPFRSPSEQTSWGNSVPGEGPVAGTEKGVTVTTSSRGGSGTTVTQGGHQNARPRPGAKERKVRVAHPLAGSRAMRLARAVVYGGTEFADAVHAVWGAVPAAARRKAGCQGSGAVTCRAMWIFNHMDQVNWPKAVLRLITNHFTDEVIGRANGRAAQHGTRLGIRTSAVNSASGGGVAAGF